ncbi:Sensor histidine kinase YpdA [Paenibacillus konkukensis]|uniref:Sensor histidine kinase YpdA n=1 Tax=Paenibacillus konkukensis TaxID=2020716 RepID=A0ABY4RR72_9BACL|nr:sensor histidine kinase [Paenibacillus konkukensis]UQZ84653.1 Sensor histidine kinase YpdA [Paenibacillus konkukensis]
MFKWKLNWKSVGFKLFIVYFGSIVISLPIIGMLSYNKSKETIESKVGGFALDSVKQANYRLNMLLKDYENRAALIFSLKELQMEIKNQFDDNYSHIRNVDYINKFFSDFINSQNDTVNLYIFGEYGSSMRYSTVSTTISMPIINIFQDEPWYKQVRDADGAVVWLGQQAPFAPHDGNEMPVFTFGRAIKDLSGNMDIIGIFLYDVNMEEIVQILSDISVHSPGQSFIINKDGVIIGDSDGTQYKQMLPIKLPDDESGMETVQLDGKEQLVVYDSITNTDFKTVKIASIDELLEDSRHIGMYTVYLIITFAVAGTLLAFALVRHMNKPIYLLLQFMNKVRDGEMKAQITDRRKDEFGLLFEHFNLMVAHMKNLIEELYIQQLLKKDIQMKMMVSQINAHFLYNTLDSIHWIARVYKADEISSMIFHLSKYLRLSLNEGRDIATVREVIELVESYISIQKVRYQDKFDVQIDTASDVYDCMVLKHIFQPLVENAIYHGIEKKKGKGYLRICWKQDGDSLVFSVEDNGAGIAEAKLSEIRSVLENGEFISEGNFALKNINSQIKLGYGDPYGLDIESEQGAGTRVTVTIPLNAAQNAKNNNTKNKMGPVT